MLGSYSNALPGQDSSSGPALPIYRVSDGSAFGSMSNVEWQQLEVRPAPALQVFTPVLAPLVLSKREASTHNTQIHVPGPVRNPTLKTVWLQEFDPLTDKAYTDLILPPWPFWRACEAVGLPVMLLMLAVNEVCQPGAPVSHFQIYPCKAGSFLHTPPCDHICGCRLASTTLGVATLQCVQGITTLLVSHLTVTRPATAG